LVEEIECDVVVVGGGLAGLRASIEAAKAGKGRLRVALVSKTHPMRSHSVSAEGGTAAVLYPDEGDSIESHVWDTVKGSDFLADQPVVERFAQMAPQEIIQLEHWGMPWARRSDGRIAQRLFGGQSYPRACYAEDRVGFFEMSTLYDTSLRFDEITIYDEWFMTSILRRDGRFAGIVALSLKTGELGVFRAKAGVLATGGAGRIYSFASFGHSSTPDGHAAALRAGLPLMDMEFVQFHPTGLVPSGILITEASRGEGGILRNARNERFMERYAPKAKDLAPRDIVSRAMVTEIREGRGLKTEEGEDYLLLDLTVIEPEVVKKRLTSIREICLKNAGIDPIEEPIPVRPVAHYFMGGVATDIDGATELAGLWAAGEVACNGLNGANRLGSNSTTECLVWGRITGGLAARFATSHGAAEPPREEVEREEKRIFDKLLGPAPRVNPYDIKHELQKIMEESFHVFREQRGMEEGLKRIRRMKEGLELGVADKSRHYNTNLTNVLEIEAMLEVCEVIGVAALNRKESRGAHARVDYPQRDDANWLRHTLVYRAAEGLEISYRDVAITTYRPVERQY
jgi:succinate dehydrogenase / fumarate reductase flavoprotein subunit